MSKAELLAFVESLDWKTHIENEAVQQHVKAIQGIVQASSHQAPKEGEDEDVLASATRLKLVVVGDGAVGKTSLLISYATGKFPTEYVPTVFENYTAQMKFKGQPVLLSLWDTAGQEDYDRLRPLSYPGADIVLLCFSTINRASHLSIKEKWYPEVNHYIPNIPYVLVGTKIDCRAEKVPDPNSGKFDPITKEMGQEMCSSIGASEYLEISSRTREGLETLFERAVTLALQYRQDPLIADDNGDHKNLKKKKQSTCMLL